MTAQLEGNPLGETGLPPGCALLASRTGITSRWRFNRSFASPRCLESVDVIFRMPDCRPYGLNPNGHHPTNILPNATTEDIMRPKDPDQGVMDLKRLLSPKCSVSPDTTLLNLRRPYVARPKCV